MSSKVQVVKAIREEYKSETGEDPGKSGAEVILDRRLQAFNEFIDGVGMVYAVRQDRLCADYMQNWWVGAEYRDRGRELREVLTRLDQGEQLRDDEKVLELEPTPLDIRPDAEDVDPAATPAGIAPDGLGDEAPVFASEDGVTVAKKAPRKPRVRKVPLEKSV